MTGEPDDELVGLIAAFAVRHDQEVIDDLARRHVRAVDGWCTWCGISSNAERSPWPCRPAQVVIEARRTGGGG